MHELKLNPVSERGYQGMLPIALIQQARTGLEWAAYVHKQSFSVACDEETHSGA